MNDLSQSNISQNQKPSKKSKRKKGVLDDIEEIEMIDEMPNPAKKP